MADVADLDIDPPGHSTRVGAAQDMTRPAWQTAKLYRLFLREPRFRLRLPPFFRPQKTRANTSAATTTISGRMAPIVVPLAAVP